MPSSRRSSLGLPITLAVIMIVLVILVIVGGVIATVMAAGDNSSLSRLFWMFFILGTFCLSLILAGTITYLVFSIKVIKLTRMQSNFIDSVTHELKSPLASIKLYLQTLTKYEVSPTERQKFYDSMMEDTERLEALINQVLRVGQIENRQFYDMQQETFDLRQMLEKCISGACRYHHAPETCVTLRCPSQMITYARIPLEMIFRNLIENGIKYGGTPPEVTVDVRWNFRGRLAARISDNGQGIPRGMRKKIFRPFYRMGNELERKKVGTGLGLYIVRLYVGILGGGIRVRNNKSGGSSFYLTLPAGENKE